MYIKYICGCTRVYLDKGYKEQKTFYIQFVFFTIFYFKEP